jgi:prophage regulatory protein
MDSEIVGALDLEKLTGTKASTWRYWASIGTGPASFKLGRRRVWRKSDVMAWIAQQQIATGLGGSGLKPIDRPNTDQLARGALDDLGLVFDNNTEDPVGPNAGGVMR